MISIAGAITMLAGAILCVGGMRTELYATRNTAYLLGERSCSWGWQFCWWIVFLKKEIGNLLPDMLLTKVTGQGRFVATDQNK